ncbi:MAG: NAD-glutamate dehydrogenase, partial [Alphaproteobacteria bacterium]|nr:NAD-glutamate dehydrogenase [Alphaproteobacteria bacterium]
MPKATLLKTLSKNPSALFRDFAQAYVAGLQNDDVANVSPPVAAEMLQQIWAFGKKRVNDESLIEARVVEGSQKGWLHERTRIFIVSTDRAFIIDSITAELNRRNLVIRTLLHPVVSVKRDDKGVIQAVEERDQGKGTNESWLVIEVQGAIGATQAHLLVHDLQNVMNDVMLATRDWQRMKTALRTSIADIKKQKSRNSEISVEECEAFLRYLHDNNFTLLGYREYKFSEKGGEVVSTVVPNQSLGVLSDERNPVYVNKSSIPLPQDLQRLRKNAPLVSVYKVNRRSTVHRNVPLDAVTVKTTDAKGNVIGEKLFIGLFTSVTYSRSVSDVPLIRAKVRSVIEESRFAIDSHDFRAIAHILEKYPRDELFQMSTAQIATYAKSILHLQDRPRLALYPRVDEFRRYISCLIYIPRDRYETNLRLAIQRILETELEGKCENFYTTLDDSPVARVIYVIATEQRIRRTYDFAAVERKLVEASRTWAERLNYSIMESTPDERQAIALSMSYDTAFDAGYQENHSANQAISDITKIEEAIRTHRIALDFYEGEGGDIRL